MIFRRLPASSSFVLAAARLRALQLDPGRATRRPGTCEEDPEEQSAQPGRQDVATGPDPYALLTVVALMGADERAFRQRCKSALNANLALSEINFDGAWVTVQGSTPVSGVKLSLNIQVRCIIR